MRLRQGEMAHTIALNHRRDDEQTLYALERIERRRAVARARVPEGYEAYFQDQARFLSAHSSVSIEGNPLDYQTAQIALLDTADEDPNRREARNASEACDFAAELAADPSLRIDQGLIRTFNSVMLKGLPGRAAGSRGRYRLHGAMIVDTVSGETNYVAPPAEWIPELMDSLEQRIAEWVRDDPPEIAAAKTHFGLISIHPFADGNGRTARLTADLILQQMKRSADGMLSISGVLLERRPDYYAALRAAQGPEFIGEVDITVFVRFHTEALAAAVTRLEERTALLDQRRRVLEERFGDQVSSRRVVGLMYLFDLDELATSAYARFCGCAQPTALSDLNELARAGIVERIGRGRNTRYELTQVTRDLMAQAG